MSIETITNENEEYAEPSVLDHAAIKRDAASGSKAIGELLKNAGVDWSHWSRAILGLRGLRSLAFEKAGTNDMTRQAYRDAMSSLLSQRQYANYDKLDKQTRSACYRLMDRIEDIDAWYGELPENGPAQVEAPGHDLQALPAGIPVDDAPA